MYSDPVTGGLLNQIRQDRTISSILAKSFQKNYTVEYKALVDCFNQRFLFSVHIRYIELVEAMDQNGESFDSFIS